MEQFKITLAAARVNAGMTQDDVTKALNVSKTTIVNWETGKTIPATDKALELAELYRIPLELISFKK
jgi:DNA-binding XRE family transcriptional regulator